MLELTLELCADDAGMAGAAFQKLNRANNSLRTSRATPPPMDSISQGCSISATMQNLMVDPKASGERFDVTRPTQQARLAGDQRIAQPNRRVFLF